MDFVHPQYVGDMFLVIPTWTFSSLMVTTTVICEPTGVISLVTMVTRVDEQLGCPCLVCPSLLEGNTLPTMRTGLRIQNQHEVD